MRVLLCINIVLLSFLGARAVDVAKLRSCLDAFADSTSLDDVCQSSERAVTLTEVVREHFGICLKEDLMRDLRITVPNASLLPVLQRHAVNFQQEYNITVRLNVLDAFELAQEVRSEARQQLQGFSDGWIVDPSVTGDLAAANALANMTSWVFNDQDLAWADVANFFRVVSAYFDKQIVGVPLDGDLLLMYYRRDLFDLYNLSVPVTWEEFTEVTQIMNGTDTDGDGVGDLWGVCLDNSMSTCKSLWLLTAVLAPYVQYRGTDQGVYFDPATMKPLINNAAMLRALDLYRRLFAVEPKPNTCFATNPFFNNGSCLMTINFGDQFKVAAQRASADGVRRINGSMLGVSRLPGSAQVLNRTSGQLVPCTSSLCPYSQLVRLANGSSAWVNYAPFSAFGGWTGMVNARASSDYQKWAFKFFSYVSKPANSLPDVLNVSSGIDPYRTSQLQPTPENLAVWAAHGYDTNATMSYLSATGEALNYKNMVLDIRLRDITDVTRFVMSGIADNTTWLQQPVDQVLAFGQMVLELMLNRSGTSGQKQLQVQYWQLIGYTGSGSGPGRSDAKNPPSAAGGGGGLSTRATVLLAVLIPGVAVLLSVVVGLLVWRRMTRHRNLLYGAVKAPLASAQTSLLITDIQDSTSLWEALSDDVMDTALKTHHAVVRQALTKHNGYESATEGDSFILAFHTAEEAVACALRIQTDLLAAFWPPALLRCVECTSAGEIWVAPARAGQQHSALVEMLCGTSCELKSNRRGPFCMVRSCFRAAAAGGGGGGAAAAADSETFTNAGAGPPAPGRSAGEHSGWRVFRRKPSGHVSGNYNLGVSGRSSAYKAEPEDAPGLSGQLQMVASAPYKRLSTISGVADDDSATMGSHTWSGFPEGLSPQPDDAQTGRRGLVAALSSMLVNLAHLGRKPHQQNQHPHLSSQQLLLGLPLTDKTDHAVIKNWLGGAGGSVIAGGPGFDSGRLLRDHIKSVWLVVDRPTAQVGACYVGRSTLRGGAEITLAVGAATAGTRKGTSTGPVSRLNTDLPSPRSSNTTAERADDAAVGPGPAAELDKGAAATGGGAPGSLLAELTVPVITVELSAAAVVRQSSAGLPSSAGQGGAGAQAAVEAAAVAAAATVPGPGPPMGLRLPPAVSCPSGSSNESSGEPVYMKSNHQQQQQQQQQPQQQQSTVLDEAVGSPTCRTHPVRQVLVFRGLRVRMGIHSGVPDSAHVLYNQAEARYHYSGSGMAIARAVQGAAAGGQVLLSDTTFALVRDARHSKLMRDAVLIHAGEHVMDRKLSEPQQLYQALPRQLLCRLPLQPPLKIIRTVSAGALDAPVGRVAVAFLSVVGAATLQAWNPDVMRRALAVFQDVFAAAAAAKAERGAYVVECTGGLLLAAFASAADALATCLAVQSGLLLADWPPELLEHDMCEQVTIATPQVEGTIVREVLFRGLRVKAGIDFGLSRAALNGATGRIAYRGRVMNRAARINAHGSSGQVLCSSAAWQAAAEGCEGGPAARGLAALSLGPVTLKGIGEPLEVLEVRPLAAAPQTGASALLSRIMMAPGSLTVPPAAAAAAAAAATSVSGLPLIMTTSAWEVTRSIRRSASLSAPEEACAMMTTATTTSGAAAPPLAGGGPLLASVSPFSAFAAAMASTSPHSMEGTAVPHSGALYGGGGGATAAGGGGRDLRDSPGAPPQVPPLPLPLAAATGLSQRSCSGFVSLPPLLQVQRTEGSWLSRGGSRRRLVSSQRDVMRTAETVLAAPVDAAAATRFVPRMTVQVYRVDANTGIAALEVPVRSPVRTGATTALPSPSPPPAPPVAASGAGPAGSVVELLAEDQAPLRAAPCDDDDACELSAKSLTRS